MAIDRFLNLTVKLTPRWFNKPKFHILLHLPEHIRLFGPANLFSTETFESYNAIIRDFSVHSNRQAPSRDIGRCFANMNRIRHIISGGNFHMESFDLINSKSRNASYLAKDDKDYRESALHEPHFFRSAGTSVKEFVDENPLLRKLLGFPEREEGVLKFYTFIQANV